MAAQAPVCDFGWRAVDFSLPGVDGKTTSLADVAGERGTLVVFMCNHCPYVVGAIDRIVQAVADLRPYGIGAVAINSNDAVNYPADSFENMKIFAREHSMNLPYLYDESQAVARAYDAVCTPDFFGFDADLGLQYRGRIDAGGRALPQAGAPRELFDAMVAIAETGRGPQQQTPSMGCSIKWRAAA